MKRSVLALALALLTALSACTGGLISFDPPGVDAQDGPEVTPEGGLAAGYLGDTMDTAFFDFTVNRAVTSGEFDGLDAQQVGVQYNADLYGREAWPEGYKFLAVEITLHNDTIVTQPMSVQDFQIQWDSQEGESPDENYAFPVCQVVADPSGEAAYASLSQQQLPASYELGINEERTGILLYVVPAGAKDYGLYFEEYYSDDTVGDLFLVSFNAEQSGQ